MSNTKDKQEKHWVSLRIDQDVWREVKANCDQEGRLLGRYVETAILDYLRAAKASQ